MLLWDDLNITELTYCNCFIKTLKSNVDKCDLVTNSKSQRKIQIGETSLISINRVKLLGKHIDGRLNFGYHVCELCKKASKNPLTRICKYMDQKH